MLLMQNRTPRGYIAECSSRLRSRAKRTACTRTLIGQDSESERKSHRDEYNSYCTVPESKRKQELAGVKHLDIGKQILLLFPSSERDTVVDKSLPPSNPKL